MLLVLCVDLDDDLGRKTGRETPVVGRDAVASAASDLAVADPEDSDVNVLFQGVRVHDDLAASESEAVEIAAVTGTQGGDVQANRALGEEVDTVLAGLSTGESVGAVVITDGAQDESTLPVIRSRVPIESVQRVVVRQAQDLESIYYTMKQVLADPETRGTILVPLGVLLLIYPAVTIAGLFDVPGAVLLGVLSAVLGLYTLFRGLGLERAIDDAADRARRLLYTGRVTLVTYVVAAALMVVGGVQGVSLLEGAGSAVAGDPPLAVAAFIHGAVRWFAAAGVTSSLGQVTDEYLNQRFEWRYLNAPFYVVSIALVLFALTGYFLPPAPGVTTLTLADLAFGLTAGTLLGVLSTLGFAVAESRFSTVRGA
jgi:putative membrane protein